MTAAQATPYVRWSELEIDPARLDRFLPLAEENVRSTRRDEPGVLAFHMAAERAHPNRIRVLEIYAGTDAYQGHLQSPHFQAFREGSAQMVSRKQLFEALPVKLAARPQAPPPEAYVCIDELEIHPAQLDAYKAILSGQIDAAIGGEPGVYAVYALALKDSPHLLRVYEIYADRDACLLHRQAPHFRDYLDATRQMIVAHRSIETAAAQR